MKQFYFIKNKVSSIINFMEKNVLVFLADGFEEIEALTPVDYLRRAGVNVILAATRTSSRNVKGAHEVTVLADITLDSYLASVGSKLPDAVVVPGGMPGALNISNCNQALSLIDAMVENKKIVAAICAAPALVLSKTKALEGKKWTCYPNMETEKDAQKFACNHLSDIPFVKDGLFLTGRGPGAAEQFSMELVNMLCGTEIADKIKKASVQRD